jgi:hypothetical protein
MISEAPTVAGDAGLDWFWALATPNPRRAGTMMRLAVNGCTFVTFVLDAIKVLDVIKVLKFLKTIPPGPPGINPGYGAAFTNPVDGLSSRGFVPLNVIGWRTAAGFQLVFGCPSETCKSHLGSIDVFLAAGPQATLKPSASARPDS